MRWAYALGLTCSLAAVPLGSARAQQPSYGQYLVVLDDSGSMDQSDPDRLVVMAALALGAALEDGDQVMLVGLNELASGGVTGPAFVSPRELLPGRDAAEGTRQLRSDGVTRLGRHQGQTPCREALARARTILESVASSGAPQTLLLLTDGACTGGLEPADAFLGGLRAHREDRFRFVPLMRAGRGRPDRQLAEYAQRTGWTEAGQVAFDARSLTRAFADVLSFSRGLRYDEGGRVGLERTFAGARTVRILAIQPEGVDRIALERIESGGGPQPLAGGPTFRHPEHGWSLRVATDRPSDTPYAVRSPTPGTEVLVIPVYGRLRVEGVVGPCGDPPPLPWDAERAVRAGQPACAWARLVGDRGETIHPTRSFAFQVELCTTPACDDATAMQPSEDGTFNAQLGAEIPTGRHERAFRAHGGALATPIVQRRGFSAMAFGVHRVARAAEPDRSIDAVELGAIPKPTADDVSLVLSGTFPAGTRAAVACDVDADEAIRECVSCDLADDEVELQDPFRVQATVRASHFCQPVSDGDGELPVRLRLTITPASDDVSPHVVPIQATLTYAETPTIEVSFEGGERLETGARVPSPMGQAEIEAHAEELDTDEIEAHATHGGARLAAGEDRMAELPLVVRADDCCGVGEHHGTLVLTPAEGGPSLRIPLVVDVRDPGWWTCPGKQIAMWVAIALGVLFLIWLVHGFVSPEKFREGAVLMWASSHDQLLGLRDGDEGWRRLQRFPETKRGFRRHAALWLGGPRAPLPSLKRMPADASIEASPGGGARLIVKAPGLEKFEESTGWTEIAPGTYPVSNRITLRRGDEIYLQFRR